MLLVVDVGNTNIVLGLFRGDRLRYSWRISTRRGQTADEYGVLFRSLFSRHEVSMTGVEAVVICSVVPPLNDCFAELSRESFGAEPCFVESEQQSLMPIRYFQPADVGADRIVNAIAARELFGVPAIIVDFGTATTFDAVSREGEYLGGIIAPGIGISAEALFSRAAKLPRIEIKRPEHGIGRSTVESMQSGIFYGYVGLVDEILRRMDLELSGANITATGGLAKLIATEFDGFDRIEDNLTMYGLRIFYEQTLKGK